MKRLMLYVTIVHFSLFVFQLTAKAQLGPTMGWSSWNTFALNINEELIKGQADAMAKSGLKDAGYQFINIDDGYWDGRGEDGHLRLNTKLFPSGMRSLVDYIHSLGLKAGIYSDAGDNTCGSGNRHAWGIGVGFAGHEDQDCKLYFIDWDFDFIKVDYCGGAHMKLDEQEQYTKISNAIKNCGKPGIVYNMCRWAYPGTWSADVADSWRTTGDIYDAWRSVRGILAENLYLAVYCKPGHYNDMDMLEVGRSMSQTEDETHFGMWCIMNSPLLIGCDMRNIRKEPLELMKNADLIGINQDKTFQQAYLVKRTNDCYILTRDIEKLQGTKRVFAIYNPTDEPRYVTVNFRDIELEGSVQLRDCFAQREIGTFATGFQVTVPAHGTRIYKATGEKRIERIRYEAETAFISDYQEIRNNQAEKTGIYVANNVCSSGYKACWLGQSEKNDLVWDNVYVQKGGKRNLTIAYMSAEDRQITVSVNGQKVQTLTANSGDWGRVGQTSIPIKLKKGRNTIRLSNADGWMPDIDYINVEPLKK